MLFVFLLFMRLFTISLHHEEKAEPFPSELLSNLLQKKLNFMWSLVVRIFFNSSLNDLIQTLRFEITIGKLAPSFKFHLMHLKYFEWNWNYIFSLLSCLILKQKNISICNITIKQRWKYVVQIIIYSISLCSSADCFLGASVGRALFGDRVCCKSFQLGFGGSAAHELYHLFQ